MQTLDYEQQIWREKSTISVFSKKIPSEILNLNILKKNNIISHFGLPLADFIAHKSCCGAPEILHETYYDTTDFTLLHRNIWLKSLSPNHFIAKFCTTQEMGVIYQPREYTTLEEAHQNLGLTPSERLVEIAKFKTTRIHYLDSPHTKFYFDITQLNGDWHYLTCKLHLSVPEPYAEDEAEALVQACLNHIPPNALDCCSKMAAYIQLFKPNLFQSLCSRNILDRNQIATENVNLFLVSPLEIQTQEELVLLDKLNITASVIQEHRNHAKNFNDNWIQYLRDMNDQFMNSDFEKVPVKPEADELDLNR